MRLQIICLLFTYMIINKSIGATRIPDGILQCYRGSQTESWIPYTKQLLLELIRKVEDANPTSLDIRRLSVNIIHGLRFDGIERSPGMFETEFRTPYAINGIMAAKYGILLQLISNTPGSLNFTNYLTTDELCQLHRIVSSSVEPFSRGDEHRTCPMILMSERGMNANVNRQPNVGRRITNTISRCPIENGVIQTNDYGSLSPGIFIAAVAAGLQPQNVQIRDFVSQNSFSNLEMFDQLKDSIESSNLMDATTSQTNILTKLMGSIETVDNMYASGLAGDLAEVCLFQGAHVGVNISVGLAGSWNDTLFPRIRYLSNNHNRHWELTDAEILGGLDSIFIAQEVALWLNRIGRIRLSQLIDMYYSPRGIPVTSIENINRKTSHLGRKERRKHENFLDYSDEERYNINDGINQACHRRKILELIDEEKLKHETYNLAQILQYTTPSLVISDISMRKNCDIAVDRFFDYSKILLDTLADCNKIPRELRRPAVDLTLIIDGYRRDYGNLQLISHIAEIIDVSSYGSHISVIHGSNGEYLVNRTNSVSSVFMQLKNFTGNYPTILSLSRSLTSYINSLANQSVNEQQQRLIAGTSKVILIISQSNMINQADFASASRLIDGTLRQFPDLYFIFVTNSPSTFNQLINGTEERSEHYSVIASTSMNPTVFSKDIITKIRQIPKRIMAPFCHTRVTLDENVDSRFVRDEYEEYLSPDIEVNYRISPYYLRFSREVNIQFIGVGYGTFTVCMSRQSDYTPAECKNVNDNDISFNFTNPCENIVDCNGIYFSILMDSSNLKCTENDCRYPDQVRFIIRQNGLRCESDGNGASAVSTNFSFIFFLSLLSYFVYFNKN